MICEKVVFAKGLCRNHYQKEYQQSDAFKEYRKKYRQSDAYKEYRKKYRQSDAFKEYQKKYQQSDAFKESRKKYQQSDAYKESQRNRKPSIKLLKEDFFKHFSRVCRTPAEWESNSALFAKTACELTKREQCVLQEEILKEVKL